MDSGQDAIPYRMAGCPIRRSPDQCSLAAPRGLSQLTTSFIGTRRLGIHRMPFIPSSSVPCRWERVNQSAVERQEGEPPSLLFSSSASTRSRWSDHSAMRSRTVRCGSTSCRIRPVSLDEPPAMRHGRTPDSRPTTQDSSQGLVVSSLLLLRCKSRLSAQETTGTGLIPGQP